MSVLDIRVDTPSPVEKIVFSSEAVDGWGVAHCLTTYGTKFVAIRDSGESVLLTNKEHAENLIKALQKAIELGWLK